MSETGKSVFLVDKQTGVETELPVMGGTIGPEVMDIRSLYGSTGMFTYDPGYGATGSCESGLT